MNDDAPTCRPCGIKGKVTYATWIFDSPYEHDWYVCDEHSKLIHSSGPLFSMGMRQLPNAWEIRERNRK